MCKYGCGCDCYIILKDGSKVPVCSEYKEEEGKE
jgi:hypothetical protein